MARTSKGDLDRLAAHIEKITGRAMTVGWAYGRPRLETRDGAADISPRLPSGQLLDWMHAYLDGWMEGQRLKDFPVTLIGDPEHAARQREAIQRLTRRGNRPRRTRRRQRLIRDVQFFQGHAGGVVGEATLGALHLARAEQERKKRGWEVTWEPDDDADWSWMTDEEKQQSHEVYVAVLWDQDPTGLRSQRGYSKHVLASLGGIFDPDREYMQVVEAELAAEALSRAK